MLNGVSALPSFDKGKAMEMAGGDEEFLKELVQLFLADYPEKLSQIQQALQQRDANTLYQVAHSLKGACANLGLERARALSFEIEKRGREEKLEGVKEIYEDLRKELEDLKGQLLSGP